MNAKYNLKNQSKTIQNSPRLISTKYFEDNRVKQHNYNKIRLPSLPPIINTDLGKRNSQPNYPEVEKKFKNKNPEYKIEFITPK